MPSNWMLFGSFLQDTDFGHSTQQNMICHSLQRTHPSYFSFMIIFHIITSVNDEYPKLRVKCWLVLSQLNNCSSVLFYFKKNKIGRYPRRNWSQANYQRQREHQING